MVDENITVEETVTVEESLQFLTPPPKIYTDARNEVLALRNKIMQDLVAGRVKALLDAGHDSMNKYRGRIDKLGVTTYLFGDLRRKAMVIRLKGYDLGEGIYRYAKTEFDQPLASYPLSPPYAVPQRLLPQVDVFKFTLHSAVDVKEMEGGAQLQGMISIQCANNVFEEEPDAENALYDYYFLYPTKQYKSVVTPTSPIRGVIKWEGLYTSLTRGLTPKGETGYNYYTLYVWFDSIVELVIEGEKPTLIIARVHKMVALPNVTFVIGQYRINTVDEGCYMTMQGLTSGLGWYKVASEVIVETEKTEVWSNNFIVTLTVNNPSWGHTNPVEGEYTVEAEEGFEVGAVPENGYKFDIWKVDGVETVTANPFTFIIYKPVTIEAVFSPV